MHLFNPLVGAGVEYIEVNFDRSIPIQFGMTGSNSPDIQLDAIVCRIFSFLLMPRHLKEESRVAVEIRSDMEIPGYLYITIVLVAYTCQVAGEAGSGIVYYSVKKEVM
jgi:hypothetical protein